MNYAYQYFRIIANRVEHPITRKEQYVECHHVIPKSEGGKDTKDNLVNLTAREHYVCHLLLAKIYNDFKMWSAITYFKTDVDKRRIFRYNSHLYEVARVRRSMLMSGECHPLFGRHLSNETRLKISKSTIGRQPWNVGKHHSEETKIKLRKPKTEEHRRKLSEALKGRKLSMEQRKKISKSMTGKPGPNKGRLFSDEWRKNISLGGKGKKKSDITRMRMSESSKKRMRDKKGKFVKNG